MKTTAPKESPHSVKELIKHRQPQENLSSFAKTSTPTSIKAMLRSYKGGKRGVYVRVTINRDQEYYPTGYYIDEKDFDISSGIVKSTNQNKDAINSYIRYLTNELDGVLTTLKKSKDVISLESFKRHYNKRIKKGLSFEDYFNAALEEKKVSIEESTVRYLLLSFIESCCNLSKAFLQFL